MHATYTFIIEDDCQDEDLTTEEGRNERLVRLGAWFDGRYGDDVCDENNWYTVYGAVLRDGTVLGSEEFVKDWTERHPDPSTRFEAAMRFAAGCVATDMELYGGARIAIPGVERERTDDEKRLDTSSRGDIIEAIYAQVPPKLAERYANFEREPEDPLAGYRRKRLAEQFEKFHDAGLKPFSAYGNPYEYRAFDIRYDGRGAEPCDDDVILLVDIHT